VDFYLRKCNKLVAIRDMHILGVTAMFMASKMEDIEPFTAKMVHYKIAHQSLSKRAIILKEKEMLEVLGFDANIPTVHCYTSIFLVKIFEGTEHENYQLTESLVEYLSKYSQYDADLSSIKQNELAGAVIYLSFVILGQIIGKI
jgi:hypothetical protein